MARSQDIERETKRQSKHEGDEDGLWLQLDVYQKPDTSKDAEDAVPGPTPMFDGVEDDTPNPPAAPAAQTKLFLGMSSSTWATSVGLSVAILLIGLVCEPWACPNFFTLGLSSPAPSLQSDSLN